MPMEEVSSKIKDEEECEDNAVALESGSTLEFRHLANYWVRKHQESLLIKLCVVDY